MGLEKSGDISLALMGEGGKAIPPQSPHSTLTPTETHCGKSWRVHPPHLQGSGLSSLPRLQPQELSCQIAPTEELPGSNLNPDASPVAKRHDPI